jgi:NTP pyrophosphatase (non-canonical NTP hydrolase)
MDLNEYQEQAAQTAHWDDSYPVSFLAYATMGLAGETGEAVDKIKKIFRNDNGIVSAEKKEEIKKELGDVLWYLSQIARELDIAFADVAKANIAKLADRAARGVIKSEGDNR